MRHEVRRRRNDWDEDEVLDARVGEGCKPRGTVLRFAHHDVTIDDLLEGLVIAARQVGGGYALRFTVGVPETNELIDLSRDCARVAAGILGVSPRFREHIAKLFGREQVGKITVPMSDRAT